MPNTTRPAKEPNHPFQATAKSWPRLNGKAFGLVA
jgi:hypothetical protein